MSSRFSVTAPRNVNDRSSCGAVISISPSLPRIFSAQNFLSFVRPANRHHPPLCEAISMKLVAPLALALCLTTSLAQAPTQTFTDPANLRGERVTPLDGRELPIDQGARGLQQLLRRLNTRASLLLITAHPDDEDGGMLTLYSRGLGARAATLTLNRGEGGQNAVTGDFEDALGLLRTQELLSADRYFGVDQMFGTEVDFGFSKTKEESFAKWDRQRVLYDAVRAIRLYRPLVIAAVFIGGVTDGHGQHQVSGEIAQEAFKAAADPNVFPELTAEGILPWQALKVYARVPMQAITPKGLFDYATGQYAPARFTNYVTGEVTTTTPSVDVVIHEGTTDPILSAPGEPERSYVQFARIGLGLQKSQIGGTMRIPPAGAFDVNYHLYGSSLPPGKQKQNEATFFDGIDTSIAGIADLAPSAKGNVALVLKTNLGGIQHSIQEAQLDFKPNHPEAAANRLAEVLTLTDMALANVEKFKADQLPQDEAANVLHELRIKRVQLNDALALALSLDFDAIASSSDIIAGATVNVLTHLSYSENTLPSVREWLVNSHQQTGSEQTSSNDSGSHEAAHELTATGSFTSTITKPYFTRANIEQPVYQILQPQLRLAPQTPPALTAWADVTFGTETVQIGRVVHDGLQPVSIVPPVSIASSPAATVLPLSQTKAELTAALRIMTSTTANINVQSPRNWTAEARLVATPIKSAHSSSIDFYLHPTTTFSEPQIFHVTAETPDHHLYTESFRPVGYPGIPATNLYTPATTRIVPVDLALPQHHRIAYLPGTGDAVPEALASIGLKPEILTIADLTADRLAQFDTIILGVRTYSAHPDLHGPPTQALLDYARSGGNVLVQYQTAEFTAADAPYPLTLGNAEKVVDETDPVQLLTPTAPLLSTPNRITPADFNNWIEERGHGFLQTWDPHYTALTEIHDPGQAPQRGGLITTRLGKGRWTYCAFAIYRQLPEAVPGAYRLFVNLLDSSPNP
jgi:LmbE family N-acetylglucosaminyl deacetylase